MARIETAQHFFNIGVIDRDKLHRVDVDHLRLGAALQTNLLCDVAGKAWLRPGLEFCGLQPASDLLSGYESPRLLPFVSGADESYVVEITPSPDSIGTPGVMRIFNPNPPDNDTVYGFGLGGPVDDYVRRVAVGTTISDGNFATGVGWTLATAAGQSSTISGGQLRLAARGRGAEAFATQSLTIALADQTKEHGLDIWINRGPVTFRLGTTAGGDELVKETELRRGYHSLAFTPGESITTVYLRFSTKSAYERSVHHCFMEPAGIVELPTPWDVYDVPQIRYAQSLDVMWLACTGQRRSRLERRGPNSWSLCDYDSDDGPFSIGRTANVRMKPDGLEGFVTITADKPFFKAGHVGAIFRLTHQGQKGDTYLAGDNQYTEPFLVTGITETNFEERKHTSTISGTWAGTLRYYRSFDGEFGDYHEYRREQSSSTVAITANASFTNDDNDDNAEVWVKIGFGDGDYTSGEAHVVTTYKGGSGYGIARVRFVTDSTHAEVEVLRPFRGTGYTDDWNEGRWSNARTQPSAVALSDGRLIWAGEDMFDASISDAYESFDDTYLGDAGPISRSIAVGGRNRARWMLPLSTLLIGCDTRIVNARASTLEEILTPDNFNMRSVRAIGAAAKSPAELADDRMLFIQNSGKKLEEVVWDASKGTYTVSDYSKLNGDLFSDGGIYEIAAQTAPDQRVWVVLYGSEPAVGEYRTSLVCIVDEPEAGVLAAHIPIVSGTVESPGIFNSVCVLPGTSYDRVYFSVQRFNDSGIVYALERLALDSEARPTDIHHQLGITKTLDSHVARSFILDGPLSQTVTGLDHLEGMTVSAWVDGLPLAQTFVVTGGQITLPTQPGAHYCVGLPYPWQYQSGKLGYGVQGYSAALKNKSIAGVGLMMADVVRNSVHYGVTNDDATFSTPWDLPLISSASGKLADQVFIGPMPDEIIFPATSQISTDSRICLSGMSPSPVSLLSLVLTIEG
jgi:hypothetical protein